MSSSTLLSVTSHSRCRICRGKTPCVGCVQERRREVPVLKKSWFEGPAGSDLEKGHFPHQSLKGKQESLVSHEQQRTVHIDGELRGGGHRVPGSPCKAWQKALVCSTGLGCCSSCFVHRKPSSTNSTHYPGLLLINGNPEFGPKGKAYDLSTA